MLFLFFIQKKISKFRYFFLNKINVCKTSRNCTGIILLGLSSEGLFIKLKKIFCCWGTLIYTTIHQCDAFPPDLTNKVVEQVGGGSVINGAFPRQVLFLSSFFKGCVPNLCQWCSGRLTGHNNYITPSRVEKTISNRWSQGCWNLKLKFKNEANSKGDDNKNVYL